jgi:hypothetical protein
MVSQSTGTIIKNALLVPEIVTATLSADYRGYSYSDNPGLVDIISSFSSRGIRRVDSFLKPDISAPGETIYSAASGSGEWGVSFNGTSMAAPHVAGVMALLRESKPTWSVEELKALVMNTATHDLFNALNQTGTMYGPGRVGAGRVDAEMAATSGIILYNAEDEGAVSVSFGVVEVVGTHTVEKEVVVVNKTGSTYTFDVSFDSRVTIPGVVYELRDVNGDPLTSLSLAGGESATIKVVLTADASLMTHTRDNTVAAAQAIPRHWISEAAGYIVLESTGAPHPDLRLAVHAAARPASDMSADEENVSLTESSGSLTLNLSGTDVYVGAGSPVPDQTSIVTAFELMGVSPNEADGIAPPTINAADLKYIGVMSDANNVTALSEVILTFGIATHAPWTTPNEVEFDIMIDVDRDGIEDYILFNWNYGSATGVGSSDAFISVLYIPSISVLYLEGYLNGFAANQVNSVPFNNNVMAMTVYASDLGLDPANPEFDFWVTSYYRDDGFSNPVDISEVFTYNPAAPRLDTTGGYTGLPWWYDWDGETINVDFDLTVSPEPPLGVLLLHHFNAGDGAEVISVERIYETFMPVIFR